MKAFTRQAYEAGLVLITCPGCQSMHLIADHLGWFGDSAFKVGLARCAALTVYKKQQQQRRRRQQQQQNAFGPAWRQRVQGALQQKNC
jgi:hypothetical protein